MNFSDHTVGRVIPNSGFRFRDIGTCLSDDFEFRDKEQQNTQIWEFDRQKDIDFTRISVPKLQDFFLEHVNFRKKLFSAETQKI